jgi:hypothetical protein
MNFYAPGKTAMKNHHQEISITPSWQERLGWIYFPFNSLLFIQTMALLYLVFIQLFEQKEISVGALQMLLLGFA